MKKLLIVLGIIFLIGGIVGIYHSQIKAAIGDIFSVGPNDEFRVDASGNIISSENLNVAKNVTAKGDLNVTKNVTAKGDLSVISASADTVSTAMFVISISSGPKANAPTGAMYMNSGNYKIYVNTGTATAPLWQPLY